MTDSIASSTAGEAARLDGLLERHRRLATFGDMAGLLAHQVRTPLAAALLYAGNAARGDLPAAQREAQLGKAIATLHDLERLVADMLAYARGAHASERRFRLAELLASVDAAVRPQLRQRQWLRLDAAACGELCLSGSRENLAGALANLVCNGLEAGGDAARVAVTADRRDTELRIRVTDNGPGIAPELRDRIFEPFVTTRADGTGLGLAVARSVARSQGGDVELNSAARGHTTFTLRLPLAAAALTTDDTTEAAA